MLPIIWKSKRYPENGEVGDENGFVHLWNMFNSPTEAHGSPSKIDTICNPMWLLVALIRWVQIKGWKHSPHEMPYKIHFLDKEYERNRN